MSINEHFEAAVHAFVDEIDARAPEFLATVPVALTHGRLQQELAQRFSPHGALDSAADIAWAVWQERGIRFSDDAADPLADELLRSVGDIIAAEGPDDFWPAAVEPQTANEADAAGWLRRDYHELRYGGEVRAYIRNEGSTPLLLINALGIPLRIWQRLLEGEHDYRLIVPVLPCCEPIAGGMLSDGSAQEHAAVLAALLDKLDLPSIDVLAWCNGGRIGVELAWLAGERIGQLLLLSPTFRDGVSHESNSAYEDNLDKLFGMVRKTPRLAGSVATLFQRGNDAPDWRQLAEPASRARTLFGLPRREFAADLVAPMTQPASLLHYAARTAQDEQLSQNPAPLGGVRISLIQGDCDAVVNNRQARAWLAARSERFDVYEVSGAGHYIHDLQYPYLIWLLDQLLLPRSAPARFPARIRKVSGE